MSKVFSFRTANIRIQEELEKQKLNKNLGVYINNALLFYMEYGNRLEAIENRLVGIEEKLEKRFVPVEQALVGQVKEDEKEPSDILFNSIDSFVNFSAK